MPSAKTRIAANPKFELSLGCNGVALHGIIARPFAHKTDMTTTAPTKKAPRRPPSAVLARPLAWEHYDLSQSNVMFERLPAPGELALWLVPTEFRFVSASNVGLWLTVAERKRARIHPNAAVGRRFGVGRATLRLLLSGVLACRQHEVKLEEGPEERIVVANLRDGQSVGVDIAYCGIWIVIAMAADRVGLKIAPNLFAPRDTKDLFAAARARAERGEVRSLQERAAQETKWHTLPLLLPGEARGAVVLERPFERVRAFGWERPFDAI